MAEQHPILQPDRFQELFDDFGDEAVEVIDGFVAEAAAEVGHLQTLLATVEPDVAHVQQVAHKLKGGCMLIGAARLQQVAVELDALGKQGRGGAAMTSLATRLAQAWAQTRAALAEHR